MFDALLHAREERVFFRVRRQDFVQLASTLLAKGQLAAIREVRGLDLLLLRERVVEIRLLLLRALDAAGDVRIEDEPVDEGHEEREPRADTDLRRERQLRQRRLCEEGPCQYFTLALSWNWKSS